MRWYAETLGFRFEGRFELPEAAIEIAYLRAEGLRLELLKRTGGAGSKREGPQPLHFCFEVADVDAAAEALRQRGVVFAQEVKRIEPAGVKNFWIEDSEGVLIEFVEVLE